MMRRTDSVRKVDIVDEATSEKKDDVKEGAVGNCKDDIIDKTVSDMKYSGKFYQMGSCIVKDNLEMNLNFIQEEDNREIQKV